MFDFTSNGKTELRLKFKNVKIQLEFYVRVEA